MKTSFKYILPIILLIATILLGNNQYSAGIYADAHGTNGDSASWFGKFGMGVFLVCLLLFIVSACYIFFHRNSKNT